MSKSILLIIFDFDGVLTDNKVWVSQDGIESVCCNRSDGLGFEMLKSAGIKSIILSTEVNQVVSQRGSKLKVPVIQGVEDKATEVRRICKEHSLRFENVAFVGNDLNDLTALSEVEHRWCPNDAAEEIRNVCTHIFKSAGGAGIVREIACFLGLKWKSPI